MIPAPYGGTKEKRQFDRPPRIARKSVSNFKSFFQTGSLRSIGESCSSFCSASLQNLSAVRGLHSLTEAVLFLSLTLLGLICSQHADTSFKKNSCLQYLVNYKIFLLNCQYDFDIFLFFSLFLLLYIVYRKQISVFSENNLRPLLLQLHSVLSRGL